MITHSRLHSIGCISFLSLTMAVCMLLTPSAAGATTNTWNGNGDETNWDDPLNWSDGVPDAGEHVEITSGASVLLTNTTADLASFTITDATLTFEGWESALKATDMTLAGTLTHQAQSASEVDPVTR